MSGRAGLLALIVASVSLNAAAQIFLRLAARGGVSLGDTPLQNAFAIALRPGIIGGLACYGLSLLLWIYVLSRAEASFAYPFLGLGFVFVALASYVVLGETLTARRLLATGLIVAGVAVLAGS